MSGVGCSFCRFEVLSYRCTGGVTYAWDLLNGVILRYGLSALDEVIVPDWFGLSSSVRCPVCGSSFVDVRSYKDEFFSCNGSCASCVHQRFRIEGGTRLAGGMDRTSRHYHYYCLRHRRVVPDVSSCRCGDFEAVSDDSEVFTVSVIDPFRLGEIDINDVDSRFIVEFSDGVFNGRLGRYRVYKYLAEELFLRLPEHCRKDFFSTLVEHGVDVQGILDSIK